MYAGDARACTNSSSSSKRLTGNAVAVVVDAESPEGSPAAAAGVVLAVAVVVTELSVAVAVAFVEGDSIVTLLYRSNTQVGKEGYEGERMSYDKARPSWDISFRCRLSTPGAYFVSGTLIEHPILWAFQLLKVIHRD